MSPSPSDADPVARFAAERAEVIATLRTVMLAVLAALLIGTAGLGLLLR